MTRQSALHPNLTFVQVRDVAPLGTDFLRVTLEGSDLTRHGDDAIHFRLLQPPKHHPADWPTLAPNGSVAWPDGPGAPHKPLYTTRSVNHATNTLVTDIFRHDGGRTTAWAEALLAGIDQRRRIGLMGPSGGGILTADHVLMASDETGFPAVARMLDALPTGATGTVFLEAEQGRDCAYPVEAPPGIELIWLARAAGDQLSRATRAAMPRHLGAQIWFAGERAQAIEIRETAKASGWEQGKLRVSAFWKAAPDVPG